MAGGTGPLDHEEALLRSHLAMTMAGTAALDPSARLRAGAVAAFARRRNLDLDLGLLAVIGVVQRDFHVIAQVRPAPLSLTPAAETARRLAEDRFENIAKVGKAARAAAPAAKARAAILERRMAKPIIGRALLRVFQALIGFGNGLELGLAVRAAPGLVRVIFHRQLAIGALDSPGIGGALNFEQFVIIDFGAHLAPGVPAPS